MTKSYVSLEIEKIGQVATIWMNRPEVFNAFNEELIADLSEACAALALGLPLPQRIASFGLTEAMLSPARSTLTHAAREM